MYQKLLQPKNSRSLRKWVIFEQIDGALQKKIWKLLKTLNFASFLKLCLDFYYCSWVLKTFKYWFFGKRDVFLEEHLKVFKNTKHGYFPSECFPKVNIAHAISKSSKLEFFWKKMTSFAKISLKDFRSTIWHFLSRLRVRFPYCFGILKTIKILVCLEK